MSPCPTALLLLLRCSVFLATLFGASGGKGGPTTTTEWYRGIKPLPGDIQLPVAAVPKGFTFSDCVHPDGGKSDYVQPWWTNETKTFAKLKLKVSVFDGHSTKTLGNRWPDVVHSRCGQPQAPSNIIFLGDHKNRRSKDNESFSDEEVAHLFDFLSVLIEEQPFRADATGQATAIGYLNDSKLIQFFQLVKNNDNTYGQRKGKVMFLHGEGATVLFGLLNLHDLSKVGYTLPEVTVGGDLVALEVMLGTGGFGTVFRSKYQGKSCVVKVFHNAADLLIEKNNLELVKDIKLPPDCLLTQFVAVSDDISSMVLEPEGSPFAATPDSHADAVKQRLRGETTVTTNTLVSSRQFCLLVDLLQCLHEKAKLVHRDIKLATMFSHGTVRVACLFVMLPIVYCISSSLCICRVASCSTTSALLFLLAFSLTSQERCRMHRLAFARLTTRRRCTCRSLATTWRCWCAIT